jgi:Protein of unknown function (DUF3352)
MSNVNVVRVIPALLAALLVALLAGCGTTGEAGNAASAVPADVALYASVDTSFEGGQWRAVRDLVAKFPDGEGALDELLNKAATSAGLSSGDGLRDALGPEVGIAVLDLPVGAEDPPIVLLTQPRDEDAFRKLVEDGQATFAEVNGWEVVASDEATLERYRDALEGPTLESSPEFAEAMDDLDDDALVHAYVNGEAIVKALATQPGLPTGAFPLPTGAEIGSIGAVLKAEGNGVRLEGRAVMPENAEGATAGEPYSSELIEEVPDGALAFLSFKGLGQGLEAGAGGLEGFLPFDLGEVARLLAGETAVYVRPGQPEPTITLVTQVDDEAAALRTVEGLVALADADTAEIAYDAFDGLLAVSTSQAEIDALRSDGPRLDQDDSFEHAAEQAGLPDETTGFGYVDLEAVLPLFLGLAPAADPEDAAEAQAYLEPLGSIVFWGGKTGSVQDFSLFVGIE